MNWHYVLWEVALTFIKAAIIYGAYSLTKYYVQYLRKDKIKKANVFEIIGLIISVIFIAAFGGGLLAGGEIKKSFVFFFIIVIPALCGLWATLEVDAKLTSQEREDLKYKIEKEDRENQSDSRF